MCRNDDYSHILPEWAFMVGKWSAIIVTVLWCWFLFELFTDPAYFATALLEMLT